MRTGPGQPDAAAFRWLQEWQQLSTTAMTQMLGHYLRGCADLAMARTPQQAWAALHDAQYVLLRHSAEAIADAARFWHK